MNRVATLIDGFNVYHSLCDAERVLKTNVKWLDLASLVRSYANVIGGKPEFASFRYFSALAHHRLPQDSGVTARHQAYISALETAGVRCQLGRFKACEQRCKICRGTYQRYEEKESDVALAVALVDAALDPDVDTVVLVTGDSDLAPALRMARRRAVGTRIGVAFPFRRVSEELKQEADFNWKLRPQQYQAHQFPAVVPLPSGGSVGRPTGWGH